MSTARGPPPRRLAGGIKLHKPAAFPRPSPTAAADIVLRDVLISSDRFRLRVNITVRRPTAGRVFVALARDGLAPLEVDAVSAGPTLGEPDFETFQALVPFGQLPGIETSDTFLRIGVTCSGPQGSASDDNAGQGYPLAFSSSSTPPLPPPRPPSVQSSISSTSRMPAYQPTASTSSIASSSPHTPASSFVWPHHTPAPPSVRKPAIEPTQGTWGLRSINGPAPYAGTIAAPSSGLNGSRDVVELRRQLAATERERDAAGADRDRTSDKLRTAEAQIVSFRTAAREAQEKLDDLAVVRSVEEMSAHTALDEARRECYALSSKLADSEDERVEALEALAAQHAEEMAEVEASFMAIAAEEFGLSRSGRGRCVNVSMTI